MIRVIKDNVERIIDNSKLTDYLAKGYKQIEIIKEDNKSGVVPENGDVSKLTVQQLKELAKERNIEGYSSLNKEELIAVLKQVNTWI